MWLNWFLTPSRLDCNKTANYMVMAAVHADQSAVLPVAELNQAQAGKIEGWGLN